MLRSIYQRISAAFGKSRRRAPGTPGRRAPARPRRLTLESLESRELLTVTTLTYNSISDGSFEAPTLQNATYQLAPNTSTWQFGTNKTRYQVAPSSSPWVVHRHCRHQQQQQRLYRAATPSRAQRQPGGLPQEQRQHQPDCLPRRRRLQPFVARRAAPELPTTRTRVSRS